ncbi:hypothetical protein [Clostridium thailandense]|uniref:hypothetical protein n=1 Tax=Clostridium thailandense TaxID=2794346 RepID=UPI00398926E2
MEYFIICKDKRVLNSVEPIGVSKEIDKNIDTKVEDEMPVQFYIKEKKENEYVDYIDGQAPLISDNLKYIFEKFQEDIFLKPAVLADVKRMRQDLYWIMIPQAVECLSPKAKFNKDGTLKRLVIDETKIGFTKIFKVDGILENFIMISLDLAESILRRDFTGIKLERVEKEVRKGE